ncbi:MULTISPECIES: ABC transporter ATP-binding protein [unclassified Neochlamydia]|uniref:metal ABC transporter ATP-binding protein n=1 Tax=unclassified Neochlamydia TaxID=2643326 RepID=UPI001BC9BF2D|nr:MULTISPECIES: ABC transporter ATP-binding protein [unclassified Neochlamydia]MBS4166866.1 Manganese transport system ATP-binding protein MntB [Neochlamydia sp. AcF65]MBS4171449.1 Manganese transport system ATP-binding protein MntB [Neochlamydia sp. AcF95]
MKKLQIQPSVLEAHQLTVNYDKTPVLWDINFKVPSGLLVGILGPNGAGKSTLIKSALGLVKPISGKIEFFGLPLKKVRKRIAYIPQRQSVDWDFPITVRDLVLMGCYGRLGLLRWPRKADRMAAHRYLEMVGMGAYADRQISQLSGGQQQRVFIARAMLQEADLYFMDEPFAGIDIATEKIIMKILIQLKAQGKSVFIVHHDLNNVENYFDWAILLNMRLVACGPVEKIFKADNLQATYGKSFSLFDEAVKLSQDKIKGAAS